MIKFENTYSKLPEHFFERSLPSAFSNPKLMAFNNELAGFLGIDFSKDDEEKLANVFSGKEILPGSEPIAMAYSGHQFGYFNPRLGDGRAHLLGEVVGEDGERYDIQLKGSGQTKYSRRGDGRSWLGPVVREYIVSEAMHHLGIPTTRALAAVRSGEEVLREEVLPGAIFTRVAKSHLRVGSFEYFSTHGTPEDLETIADYAIKRHDPDLESDKQKYYKFFHRVARRKLSLAAKWMGVGFIHGVMNTDNTSIAGITIDYGPCAFMDNFSRNKVFSSIDRQGRYAYSNQGPVAIWNLSVLANALFPLMNVSVEKLQEDFKELEAHYNREYLNVMTAKLGIFEPVEDDLKIIDLFLNYLEKEHLDFTNGFRDLNNFDCEDKEFLELWNERLKRQGRSKEEVVRLMNSSNPFIIPRNHQVQKAIDLCVEGNDDHFRFLVEAFKSPYQESEAHRDLTKPPAPSEIVHQTFCGT